MKAILKKFSVFCAGVAAFTMLAVPAMAGELVMGLIPAENNEEMIKQFEPMRAYLESKTGQKVKVFTATDYVGVIEAMRKKRVDIAWFGPLTLPSRKRARRRLRLVSARAVTPTPIRAFLSFWRQCHQCYSGPEGGKRGLCRSRFHFRGAYAHIHGEKGYRHDASGLLRQIHLLGLP